jgi:hypothetical protein
MFDFLRAIDLRPMEWSEAVSLTGEAYPHIDSVLDAAFARAQAVVVLFTPDEMAHLRPEYAADCANDPDTEPAPQARPNVLFEAGMAVARYPERTVIVEIGRTRGFSDISGRHAIRFDGTAIMRHQLANRLQTAGCAVNTRGSDWLAVGDFEAPSPGTPPLVPKLAPAAPNPGGPPSLPPPALPHGLVVVDPGTAPVLDPVSGRHAELTVRHRFLIGSLPVTQEMYAEVLGDRPSYFTGDDLPVESVTWYDALLFCNELSKRDGLESVYPGVTERTLGAPDLDADGYRLPTEAEWVFGCLGGAKGGRFPAELAKSAWYHDNADGSTHPVGELAPNGLGLRDMLGNVDEWCSDRYARGFSAVGPRGGPRAGRDRARRGGSWNDSARDVSPESRSGMYPGLHDKFTGFRVARSMK